MVEFAGGGHDPRGWHDATSSIVARADLLEMFRTNHGAGRDAAAGSYQFRLLDSDSNRHIVRIATEDGSKVITTTQAIPLKRTDTKGDMVLQFINASKCVGQTISVDAEVEKVLGPRLSPIEGRHHGGANCRRQ